MSRKEAVRKGGEGKGGGEKQGIEALGASVHPHYGLWAGEDGWGYVRALEAISN